MKNWYKLLLLSLTCLVSSLTYGQYNFFPGNIVTTDGDSIQGFIHCPTWENTPNTIWFRQHADAIPKEFSPSDIKSFRVSNSYFISSDVELEASSKQLQSLSINPKLKLVKKRIFLNVLVQGPKSLYQYTDANNVDYFFIKEGDAINLLKFKRIYDYENGPANLREIKKYIGQLIYYFKDRPDLEKYINKTLYQQSSLVALFDRYYMYNMEQFDSDKTISKIRVGLAAVLSANELVFSGANFPEYTTNVKQSGPKLLPSLFVEFTDGKRLTTWSLFNDIQYIPYRFSCIYSSSLYEYTTRLNLSYLTLSSQLRYRLHFNNVSWFMGAGISYGSVLDEINSQRMVSLIVPDRKEEAQALVGMNRSSLGLLVGTGVIYKKFSFEFRFRTGGGPSYYSDLGSATINKSIHVSYYF